MNDAKVEKSGRRRGGRAKGVKNKDTRDLFEICDKHGINVFEGLILFCRDPDKHISFNAHKEAAKYLYPQRKAVEMNATVTNAEEKKAKVQNLLSELDKVK
jgi:lipopolysaccharide export LptBFGC system permease protein LptF